MADTDVILFVLWFGLNAALMIITGVVYKAYIKRKPQLTSSSSDSNLS
jgi:hypothetical protein